MLYGGGSQHGRLHKGKDNQNSVHGNYCFKSLPTEKNGKTRGCRSPLAPHLGASGVERIPPHGSGGHHWVSKGAMISNSLIDAARRRVNARKIARLISAAPASPTASTRRPMSLAAWFCNSVQHPQTHWYTTKSPQNRSINNMNRTT